MEKMNEGSSCKYFYDKVDYLLRFFLMLITSSFRKRNRQTANAHPSYIASTSAGYKTIDEISTADQYERATIERGSFRESLSGVKLKEDSGIYLYNQSMV